MMATQDHDTDNATATGGFDFSQAQVQKTIDDGDGAWMHIAHPVSGELLYADEARTLPCEVRVLSVDSKRYADATHSIDRKLLRDRARLSSDEAADAVLRRTAAAITGFRNVKFEGRELDGANKADRVLWVGLATNFVDQIRKFAAEDEHFFGSGSGS